jgi:signal peptidase II
MGFSILVVVALALWVRLSVRWLQALGGGLIIGGAIGNLYDRFTRGSVVDFIDLQALYFPWIFNIADSAITVGVIVLIFDNLHPRPPALPL